VFTGKITSNRLPQYFLQVKVRLKRSLHQFEEDALCPSRGKSCGGLRPQVEACRKTCMYGRKVLCHSEEDQPRNGSDLTVVFQVAISFHLAGAEGVSKTYLESVLFSVYVV
jgi:hypothetical protein